ncbi:AbrB/MazE/SpoVT family DNA-binding domain-containing protein [Candidatus Woesearchaeota archaeon]|nr:MAG: AbrB/MazE/SpoVT family DNA-binding domain-containing protein [Candidatus Woesearchaeota archaeon]
MKRKVVKHGTATLTISLPSKWVKRFGIKPGDELDVEENNQLLTISTDKNKSLRKTTIDLNELGLFNKNFLSNVYQVGYDEVTINFDTRNTYQEILKRLSDCIGFEIIDQGERYCVIKSIAQISHTEFDKVLSRTMLIMLAMSRDCLDAVKKQEYSRLSEIRTMESTNNKLTDYCRRILNKIGHPDPKMTTIMYSLVHDIEKLVDEYKHVCDDLVEHKKPLDKDVLELFEGAHKYLELFCQMFNKFDNKKTQKMFSDGRELLDKARKLIGEKKGIDANTAHHISNIITKTYELTIPYFQMKL